MKFQHPFADICIERPEADQQRLVAAGWQTQESPHGAGVLDNDQVEQPPEDPPVEAEPPRRRRRSSAAE